MGSQITVHVARQRLVDLASTGHVVVVEAQAGAGKSTLLSDFARAHDGPAILASLSGVRAGRGQLRSGLYRSLRRGGLSDLAAVLEQSGDPDLVPTLLPWLAERDESLLVLIDEVQRADEQLVGLLSRLVEGWPAPHRLVLAGRRLPQPLVSPVAAAAGVLIGPAELRLLPEETRALLGDEVCNGLEDTQVQLLTEQCDGWAAAIALAGTRLGRALEHPGAVLEDEVVSLLAEPASLPDLIAGLLAPLPEQVRRAVERSAALPWVDDQLLRAAGLPGGVSQLADIGLPLEELTTGRWAISNAVRDVLADGPPDEALARLAAQLYLDAGAPTEAFEVLEAARLEQDLAACLADLPPAAMGELDPAEHAAAIGSLPLELLAAHPRILLHLGDAYVVAGQLEEYRESISRARALLPAGGDPSDPDHLEVIAADLTMRAVATDDDALVEEAERLLARADLPPLARARLLGAVGRATASRRTAGALRVAVRRIEESAQAFQREGASIHAIAARVIGATFASFPLGRYDAALDGLDRALAASRGSARVRVAILPYRAFVLIDLGRYAEADAVLAELRSTATRIGTVGNERAAAFARWGAAKMASQRGDADGTFAACRAVERSDVVVDTGHGAFFRADAAQLLARVGRFEDAERFLDGARDRDPGKTGLIATAEFVVAAHVGDTARALQALSTLDREGQEVEPRDRWRVTLLHAWVLQQAGDAGAQALAAAAFEEAAQLGYPKLPMIREPGITRALLPMASQGSASAQEAAKVSGARLRLLGGFQVEVEGRVLEPAGRPAELLALLALEGPLAVERAIDAVWPDGDVARGRERLRTVLRRLRRDVGDLIERHEDSLRLRSGVSVDVVEFLGFARRAIDPGADREGAAKAAVALYRGELVPSLAYQGWAIEARRVVQQRLLDMYDVLATIADGDGRLDDAIRANLAALEFDPTAEERYLAAARAFAEQGRRSRAIALLADARDALNRSGLSPSDDLVRLEGYLQRGPAVGAAQAS